MDYAWKNGTKHFFNDIIQTSFLFDQAVALFVDDGTLNVHAFRKF